ncbi:MAG: ORF6N domain-containing protein [Myxococcaceae bacterium]
MADEVALVPTERITRSILVVRNHRVILDADLAKIYGATTKRLNEQVKRNHERFPPDFMFRLNAAEKAEVVANCDQLSKLKFSPMLPFAFTEHGSIMAASVLNSPLAIEVSVYVVRAFIQLREALATHKDLARKLAELERKYDARFRIVFEAIEELMTPEDAGDRKQIGFRNPPQHR